MKWVRYTADQRQWAIEQMGPPSNRRIRALALATGITEVTLRTWRNAALIEGSLVRKDSGQSERHSGKAEQLLAARVELYAKARQRHPARWTRQTRDWSLANDVYLNPERPSLKLAA